MAIVLDVWKEKQAQNLTLSASLKEQLDEAFLYEKAIDRATYERQKDKLNEQILLAEMAERDAKLEGYDEEGVLSFAEHVILNMARLWTELSHEQKQRLQKVLFPEEVSFESGKFRTAATCLFFKLLEQPQGDESRLATLLGIEPRPLP